MARFGALVLLLGLVTLVPGRGLAGPEDAYYARDADGLLWFMHITDSHIGSPFYRSTFTSEHLELALGAGVSVIQPSFVAVTGDLCDGSVTEVYTAGQDQSEWNEYKRITAAAGMTAAYYYDVVGNHDAYGDNGLTYYLANSVQGQDNHATHFGWIRTTTLGDYFFYGLNATGDNVLPFTAGDGTILDVEYQSLVAALQMNASARLSFVFAHQAPGQGVNSARVVDELAARGAFYVHGHRHEHHEYLAGNGQVVVNELDSLGEKHESNLAVGVIDHDAFVYRATDTARLWPLPIITAPVSSLLRDGELNPWAYDVCKDRPDNPIRALVFSATPPTLVGVKVGSLAPVLMTRVPGAAPLYSVVVDTRTLPAGPHEITVTAEVGAESATHTITVELFAGPCTPLAQHDGGVDALPSDASSGDAAVVGVDAGVSADAGAPADGPVGGIDAGGDPGAGDGGCSCRVAAVPRAPLPLTALAALLLLRRRRRPRRG